MKKNSVRIGIIGCGWATNIKHIPSLNKIPEAEVVALCDHNLKKAEDTAKKYCGEVKLYTDYHEMLKDETIDAIHVCTQNKYHCKITCDALNAGKHVLCEKPMAITEEEAELMVKTAEKTGKKLTVGYQSRFSNEAIYLKNEADKGTFGEIYYARAIALRRKAVPTWGDFLDKQIQGGGPIIDIGSHSLDLALWIMNNYEPDFCVGTTYRKLISDGGVGNAFGSWDPKKFTSEDSGFGFVRMKNGATISVEASWALNILDPKESCVQICGTEAGADTLINGARINGIRDGKLFSQIPDFRNIGASLYRDEHMSSPVEREAHSWIFSILEDTDPVVKPAEAAVVTKILDGIYKSAESGTIYKF